MEELKKFKISAGLLQHKFTLGLMIFLILALGAGYFGYQKIFAKQEKQLDVITSEIDLSFDPEGPYAILTPRGDGNALILDIKRTASYDKISYELAYSSEGIDRGVMGDINTKEKKGEYEQEILFGTCSKNVCKYDTNVANGTLLLKIQKGSMLYKMNTQWHLQKPDVSLGILTSGDSHFTYKIDPAKTDLAVINYSIINDLSGAPKLPSGKQVLGKVYSFNSSLNKDLPGGQVTIELADKPGSEVKIIRFSEALNKWQELDTKAGDTTLTAQAPSGGIFAVWTAKK